MKLFNIHSQHSGLYAGNNIDKNQERKMLGDDLLKYLKYIHNDLGPGL